MGKVIRNGRGWWIWRFKFLLVSFFFFLLTACSSPAPKLRSGEPQRLKVVTTTGLLEDAVRNIVGDRAEVVGLMGPGVDPHLYKATHGDVRRLSQADVIVFNGLHLEGKMGEVLRKLGRHKTVVAAAEGLPPNLLLSLPGGRGAYDPHVWFQVSLWKEAFLYVSQELQRRDPKNQEFYWQRTKAYAQQLDSLEIWVRQEIEAIPPQHRILVTAHDAFGYFGRAYGLQVRGLQGISTVADYGLRDVSSLVRFLVEQRLPAIFVESSVSQRAIEAVQEGCRSRGHPIRLGGTLYSDALGAHGTPEGTYVGMVQANVRTIVAALRVEQQAISRQGF